MVDLIPILQNNKSNEIFIAFPMMYIITQIECVYSMYLEILQYQIQYLLIIKNFFIRSQKIFSNNGRQRTNSNFDRILKNSLTSIKKPWQPYQLKAQVGSSCQGCLNDEAVCEREKELWYMMNRVQWGLVWSWFFYFFRKSYKVSISA